MTTPNDGDDQRRVRYGWLSLFLLLLVMSTTALLMGLLTPSWQVVYLEDGRTEHHHGLWLDCKRDYSYDYGRPREYYETLHRRFDLAGPFDQFWLPSLLCVFKFDYWLDDQDWYEFGYDENRLWGDAYQHLFLGWKIAAFVAHLIAAICSLFSILMIICAYCHRLCTCVAAVLVTLSVVSGLGGNVVFYAFASDQNTNIIKEEDGIYEQHFGWSFWVSIVGNCLMLFTSLLGCVATKAVLGKSRTKFIKIQTDDDFDDDNTQLLRLSATSSTYVPQQQQQQHQNGTNRRQHQQQQQQKQFGRSPQRSTIYRIESNDLRRWERERMRTVEKEGHFKRTNSMPMIRRQFVDQQMQNASSISDLSRPIVAGGASHPFFPRRDSPMVNDHELAGGAAMDVIYEYVDQASLSLASTLKAGDFVRSKSKLNVYDPVPAFSNGNQQRRVESTSIGIVQNRSAPAAADHHHHQQQQQQQRQQQLLRLERREMFETANVADTEYLQPKSLTSGGSSGGDNHSSNSSSAAGRQTPLIVPIAANNAAFRGFSRERPAVPPAPPTTSSSSTFEATPAAVPPQIPLDTFPHKTQQHQRQWEAKMLLELKKQQQQQQQQQQHMAEEDKQQQQLQHNIHYHQQKPAPPIGRARPASERRLCPPILSDVPTPPTAPAATVPSVATVPTTVATVARDDVYRIQINTFQPMADDARHSSFLGTFNNKYSRSITDLVPAGIGQDSFVRAAFERGPPTESSEQSTTPTALSSAAAAAHSDYRPPTFLGVEALPPPMGSTLLRQRLGSNPSATTTLRGPDLRNGGGGTPPQSEADRSLGSSRAATFLGSPPTAAGQNVPRTFGQNASGNSGQSADEMAPRRMYFGQNVGTAPGTDV
uniref:Uncharacterized protein n=1 Tax=Globodera rostochiensis TaxID=31243 RepID=A0A914HRE1_GLORO